MLFLKEMIDSTAPPSYTEALNLPAPVRPSGSVQESKVKPKLCKMEKTSAGYGFHLNGIQGVCGQYIKEVRTTRNVHRLIVNISNQRGKTHFVSGGEGRSGRQGGSGG